MIDADVNHAVDTDMGAATAALTGEDVASLIGWWREAGVDVAVDEAPRNWLAAVAAPAKAKATEPAAPPPEALPGTLTAFANWLMTADLPEAGRRRVRPSGDPASDLMILTDVPELADLDAGKLIAGEQEEMFDRMLALMGRTRESVWLASLNPARPPSGRIAEPHLERLAALARHHIRLAAPKQLWLMGQAASRALLGIDDAAAAGGLHRINLEGVTVVAISTAHPRRLAGSKDLKRRAWADMQKLIAGTSE